MSDTLKLAFIDDDESVRSGTAEALELAGFEVLAFESAERAMRHLEQGFRGVVITDVRPPGMDGMALLARIKALDARIPVILVTGHGEVSLAVQAMRAGAYDFIEKPFPTELLVDAARKALEHCRLQREVAALREELDKLRGVEATLLGLSPAMQAVRRQIAQLADTSADVLIQGETGTGKELVARSLHDHSRRRSARFVALNCAGLPESLFESEIFGHEAGAFTGASKRRIGKIEHADGGTLFLDEIETMPMPLQIKLLRVLQERRIERLGSNQEVPVDFRLVAATKCDLRGLSDQQRFRADLYYRLNVVTIHLPPLRERRDDIPLMLAAFMSQASARYGREVPTVDERTLRSLMAHDWPGNVRELRNVADRLVLGVGTGAPEAAGGPSSLSLAEQVDRFERALLEQALRQHRGRAVAVMEALRLPKKTFYDKLRKYGLRTETYREPPAPA